VGSEYKSGYCKGRLVVHARATTGLFLEVGANTVLSANCASYVAV
jgi:hypothetical protein